MHEYTVQNLDPKILVPAPWNPNVADPEDEARLDNSISRLGMFKPILVRSLPDGKLQILGGHYRCASAIRLGMQLVPVINLGDIDEQRAKEITLIDNGRYGHDDAQALSAILKTLGSPADLATFMPYDIKELEAYTKSVEIDLDTLGLDLPDDLEPVEMPKKSVKTHEVMKFRIAVEDAARIKEKIERVMKEEGFTESDTLTNAGDALSFILLNEEE